MSLIHSLQTGGHGILLGLGQHLTIGCSLKAEEKAPLGRTVLCVSRERLGITFTLVGSVTGMITGLLLPTKLKSQRPSAKQQIPSNSK